jgi:PAS domain S-box-containing protein
MPRFDSLVDGAPTHDDGGPRGLNAWVAVALCAGWILLSNVGPTFELVPGVRAWYPPAALLVAALLMWGGRALIPIMLGAVVCDVLAPASPEPLWRVLVGSALIKGVYWLGAIVLRRLGFDPDFSRITDVARFACVFAVTAAVSAVIAVVDGQQTAAITNPDSLHLIRSFWVGDTVAIYALAPGMLVVARWLTRPRQPGEAMLSRPAWSLRVVLQVLSIPAVLVCLARLAPSLGFFAYALCFLPLGWIALHRGSRVAALANVVLVTGALWSLTDVASLVGRGLEVQAFTTMLVLTGLVVGSVADERERAFALLAASEDRHRRVVELLPDPLFIHVDGKVLFANGAAASVMGAEDGDALAGRSVVDMAAPRSKQLIGERIQALRAGSGVSVARHTMEKLDGSGQVEIESISIPFTYQNAKAALTVARDVTGRIRLEEELRHSQRMEAVGRLAGGIAHDFNNLLTVITSYSELLLSGFGPDDPLAVDVKEIHHAASRAAALTRQLLSFSRRQVLQPSPVDLNEAIQSTEGLLRRLISPEIVIASDLDAAAGTVLVDRGQLEQVIVNLAVNARDAMVDGGTLTIASRSVRQGDDPATSRCTTQSDRYAMISVRDTGVGIDADTMRRIFDPFFTTKDVGQGTGLGLATVHGIVEQFGGAIDVNSIIGEGTEFRVFLPGMAPRKAVLDTGELAAIVDADHGLGRVLVVEDEHAVRAIVRRTLRDAGYEVVDAFDGVDAMAVLETEGLQVDVVLSDVRMPRMDGRELASQIRAKWPALPVVMMSGFSGSEALDGGPADEAPTLLKPFTALMLTTAIRDALTPKDP